MNELYSIHSSETVVELPAVCRLDDGTLLVPGQLIVAPQTGCNNPRCPTGCRNVVLIFQLDDRSASFRYPPKEARELAFAILARADQIEALGPRILS